MTSHPHWKIGELAKLTGLTIRTLRYYDQIGLFSPAEHSDSGYRLYGEADLLRLQQILALKDLGLPLEEIKAILADDGYNPMEIVILQINRLKENIRVQQALLKELQNVANLLRTAEPLTVDHFTQLLSMMKRSHEKYFAEQRTHMERSLDMLGGLLAGSRAAHPKED